MTTQSGMFKRLFFGLALFFMVLTQGWGASPTISNISVTNITATTATISGTPSAKGTMYYVVTTSSKAPTVAQVKAGKTDTGATAPFNGHSGVKKNTAKSFNLNGLTTGTTYYGYLVMTDSSKKDSDVYPTRSFVPTTNVNVGERTFAIRDQRNVNGDIKVIGNTVLCVNDGHGACQDYTGSKTNAELDLMYVDVDGVNRTYNNSSQALLSIPAGAVVKWAGIYTQGYLQGSNQTTIANILKDPIYVTVPTVGTIASAPTVIDMIANEKYGFTYDTFAPLPELIGKTGSQINGWVIGANIKANTGTDIWSGLGNYGAWTLVVVYDDGVSSLKNVTVFDGYKKVEKDTDYNTVVEIPVSGFLTPTRGSVKSTLSLFVGEGDRNIGGDALYLNNVALNDTNAFSSVLMGVTAKPSFINNEGIDIQNYSVGKDGDNSHPQIIGNSATSATIKLTTTQDTYFPSMVAFSTELYVPDICYEEDITKDGSPVTTASVGDVLDVNVTITNKNPEPAQKVVVTKTFNQYLDYVENSTAIKPSGASSFASVTDESDSDTVTYDDDMQKLTLNLGTRASSTTGGTINQNQIEQFKNQVTVLKDGDFTSDYRVSFKDSLGVTNYTDIAIAKCSGLSATSITVLPKGKVRVVESGKNWGDNNGNLFMKIASNTPYTYDILFATDDSGSNLTSGEITKLDLIDRSTNTVLDTPINGLTTIGQRKPFSITLNNAYKDLQFVVTLKDGSQATSNNFSVRPATFDISGSSPIKAGEPITPFYAKGNGGATLSNYNGVATISTTLDVSGKVNCSAGANDTNINSPITFSAGVYNDGNSGTFANIGNYTLKIVDSTWSGVDQPSDCIQNSSSNTLDSNGRYGCNAELNKEFNVSPYTFVFNNLQLKNSGGNFVYFLKGNDDTELDKMNVSLGGGSISAVAKDLTTVLTNYTEGCYANPYTLKFKVPNRSGLELVNRDYESTTSSNFTNGVLTLSDTVSPKYNYRVSNYNALIEPFSQQGGSDINVSIKENVDNPLSADSQSNFDSNANKANFLYGKIAGPNAMIDYAPTATIRAYAEVYAKDAATLPGGDSGWSPAPGSSVWWINKLDITNHLSGANAVSPRSSSILTPTTNTNVTASVLNMNSGIANIQLDMSGAANKDQKVFLHLNVPSYLWYSSAGNQYSFANNSDCSTHPCISVDIFGIENTDWYGTGDSKGKKAIQTVPKGKRAPKVNW